MDQDAGCCTWSGREHHEHRWTSRFGPQPQPGSYLETNALGPPQGGLRLVHIGVKAGITVIDCEVRTIKSRGKELLVFSKIRTAWLISSAAGITTRMSTSLSLCGLP